MLLSYLDNDHHVDDYDSKGILDDTHEPKKEAMGYWACLHGMQRTLMTLASRFGVMDDTGVMKVVTHINKLFAEVFWKDWHELGPH
jgi:hypothetical protein